VAAVGSIDITSGCPVPRCAVHIHIKGIWIVNVHLCGGRIDDMRYNQLINVRGDEITINYKRFACVIGGDL